MENSQAGQKNSVSILDGGMGHLLRRNGVEITGEVGSQERFLGVALVNRDDPELVKKCHAEFINAGANFITTNSYSCVPQCLQIGGKIS